MDEEDAEFIFEDLHPLPCPWEEISLLINRGGDRGSEDRFTWQAIHPCPEVLEALVTLDLNSLHQKVELN